MEDKKLPRERPLKSVQNPAASATGGSEESIDDAEHRSSERLRHKDRAVSFWDYERMVLEEFPTIYKIGVFAGVVASLALTAWMLSNIKGPRGRLEPDTVLPLETNTATPIPVSPTGAPAGAAATIGPTATTTPTATASATPEPIAINFNADSYSIVQGECTSLRWQVVGAELVRVLGAEVEHTEAEEVCPAVSTTYTLIAENERETAESTFLIEVLEPTATPEIGCTGYDQNGQLVCKTSCGPNDPNESCELK
jgi:hypothetical protein